MNKVNIAGMNIDNLTTVETLFKIEEFVQARANVYLTNPNVDVLVRYTKDSEFKRFYDASALCVADGVPVLWAAKFLGTPIVEKVSGSDLVPEVCKLSAAKGYRLFFLGGRPGAAQLAKEKLQQQYSSIKIVGVYSPPFGFENDLEENQRILTLIKQAQPDILFVGLGAPKQERWIEKYYQELGVPVNMGVGVTFEFIAGIVKRAPRWMQRVGLEWFWRLMMEPKRLWKRYLVDDMQFFYLIFKQKLNQK